MSTIAEKLGLVESYGNLQRAERTEALSKMNQHDVMTQFVMYEGRKHGWNNEQTIEWMHWQSRSGVDGINMLNNEFNEFSAAFYNEKVRQDRLGTVGKKIESAKEERDNAQPQLLEV
ncbi:MAG: hypothetical protein AB1325_13450 [Nitrospirota bacterium]